MTCHTIQRHLDAFLDGEVDPTTQIEFAADIASCVGCQEQLVASRIVKHATKEAVAIKAPDALRARMTEMLANAEPASSREPLVRVFTLPARYSIPMAAAAMLAFVAGGFFMPRVGGMGATEQASALPLFQDVVRPHSTPACQRRSEQPAQRSGCVVVSRQGRLPGAARKLRRRSGRAFARARLSNVGERRAAALYYDVHGRRMTVVVFPGAQPMSRLRGVSVEQVRVIKSLISALADTPFRPWSMMA